MTANQTSPAVIQRTHVRALWSQGHRVFLSFHRASHPVRPAAKSELLGALAIAFNLGSRLRQSDLRHRRAAIVDPVGVPTFIRTSRSTVMRAAPAHCALCVHPTHEESTPVRMRSTARGLPRYTLVSLLRKKEEPLDGSSWSSQYVSINATGSLRQPRSVRIRDAPGTWPA